MGGRCEVHVDVKDTANLADYRWKTYVDQSISRGFWPNQTASPCKPLARQYTFPERSLRLVCAKQPANLSWRNSNITSGNVCVRANMLAKLTHERNTEFANFIVRFALKIGISNTTQNLQISLSDLPFGSKSAPPLPPPIFTNIIRERILACEGKKKLTPSQSILKNLLEAKELEN